LIVIIPPHELTFPRNGRFLHYPHVWLNIKVSFHVWYMNARCFIQDHHKRKKTPSSLNERKFDFACLWLHKASTTFGTIRSLFDYTIKFSYQCFLKFCHLTPKYQADIHLAIIHNLINCSFSPSKIVLNCGLQKSSQIGFFLTRKD